VATIHDVAERAGVSIKTVSRVLNGGTEVSEKTRTRIEQAMRSL
jgi:LacI family transcriptional regulator